MKLSSTAVTVAELRVSFWPTAEPCVTPEKLLCSSDGGFLHCEKSDVTLSRRLSILAKFRLCVCARQIELDGAFVRDTVGPVDRGQGAQSILP